jgi:peptidoglycan pentaglycine glycine transferase (the first glycine)
MTINVQEITDREQWNNFLTSQPHGHLHQAYEWGELNRYLGRRIYRLGALEARRIVGSMLLTVSPVPVLLPMSKLLPPWLYCLRGPTVEHPDSPALAALVKSAEEIARRERAVILRLEPNVADDDPDMGAWISCYHALGFRTNHYALYPRRSWVLDIRPDIEQLLANFKMTWRQNVRIAERKGVTVREVQGDADFDAYYSLMEVTSRRDNFLLLSKDYHKEILRQFAGKNDAVLYLAEHEGEAIAAKMLIRFGDWCWDMFGASSNNKRNLKPTYLLQYRCFQWARARGCSYFDFRAIPEVLAPGEEMWGVYEFKKGFGGFSRLNMPMQDYVLRPLIYTAWRKYVEIRRAGEHEKRKKEEPVRVAGDETENGNALE